MLLFMSIVEQVPPPCANEEVDQPFRMEVNSIQTDPFLGKCLVFLLYPVTLTNDPFKKTKMVCAFRISFLFVVLLILTGRIVLGKIHSGVVRVGDEVKGLSREGGFIEKGAVLKLFCQRGMTKYEVEEGKAGDILWLAGISAGLLHR